MTLAKRCAVVVSITLAAIVAMLAQSTGSLRGQVTDPSGAGIRARPLRSPARPNTVKVATTDVSGSYIIVGLPGGQYTVRASAPGFNLFEKTDLDLSVGRGSTLDVPLTVAVEKQEVTVAGIPRHPDRS